MMADPPAGIQDADPATLVRLLQNAPALVWATGPDSSCTAVSLDWQAITGQSPQDAHAQDWLDVVHPEDRPQAIETLRTAHARREPFTADYRLRQANGAYRWVAFVGRPQAGPDGFAGFLGLALDIDERKRAELALRRTQQAARFLANASMALTDMADSSSILRKVASLSVPFLADWCAVDVMGDDEGGLTRLAVLHSEPRKAGLAQEVTRRWRPEYEDQTGAGKVIRTGEPEIMEEVLDAAVVPWARDDEHRRVLRELGFTSYVCVPVRWQRKTRAALTFVIAHPDRRYETSDLRMAEDLAYRTSLAIDNAELYRAAVEADRRKDEFLAVLSHELRTPLNAIVGWTHLLREGGGGPEMIRKAVDTIHRNAEVQTRLITEILDVSRIVSGKLRLDVRPIELPVIIEAAIDTLKPAAQAKRVRLDAVLDPGAGPVSGDASRLQQVVWNLLSNAIRFVPERVGRVMVRLEAVNSHVRLTVEDNGPGIAPAFLPHVFERFRQADSSSNRMHQGLGLGLAIVRHLVELHGGTVQVANREPAPGAIFTVDLPLRSVAAVPAVEPERPASRDEPSSAETASPPSLQGVRIVIVDDQEDARDLLKAVLERYGGVVTVSASASEALAAVSSQRPDVVVTDIEMPGQSGYDFLRQLRSLSAHLGGLTPAVALTAYATVHDRVKVLRAGFQMHLSKPVQPAELAAVVASLARRAAPRY
jgi:PAS domain S-box-containing protein